MLLKGSRTRITQYYLKNLLEGKEGSPQLPSRRVVEFFCVTREQEGGETLVDSCTCDI